MRFAGEQIQPRTLRAKSEGNETAFQAENAL